VSQELHECLRRFSRGTLQFAGEGSWSLSAVSQLPQNVLFLNFMNPLVDPSRRVPASCAGASKGGADPESCFQGSGRESSTRGPWPAGGLGILALWIGAVRPIARWVAGSRRRRGPARGLRHGTSTRRSPGLLTLRLQ
jgi:hypothetical protein